MSMSCTSPARTSLLAVILTGQVIWLDTKLLIGGSFAMAQRLAEAALTRLRPQPIQLPPSQARHPSLLKHPRQQKPPNPPRRPRQPKHLTLLRHQHQLKHRHQLKHPRPRRHPRHLKPPLQQLNSIPAARIWVMARWERRSSRLIVAPMISATVIL